MIKIADIGLLYASAIWGTTFFVVKNSLQYIDPVALCSYRFLLAALILMFFLIYNRLKLFSDLKEGLILGFFLWLIYISQTIGLVFTTASNAAFITGLFIVFIPVFLLIFFKKKPALKSLFAITVALCGLSFLTGGLIHANKGDLITLITAFAYALHVLFADKYVKNNINPYTLCFQQFLFVSLLSFLTAFFFKLPFSVTKISVIWTILFLTIFPTLTAFVIQLVAQKNTAPVKVALIFALEPVFGAIFAWTLGGEIFVTTKAIGGLLVFLSLIVYQTNFISGFNTRYKILKKQQLS